MNKNKNYLYFIKKLKIKSWIKYWLLTADYIKYVISEIYSGLSLTINNTLAKPFVSLIFKGNSTQDGTPSPTNEVPIYSAGEILNLFDVNNITPNQYITSGGQTGASTASNISGYIKVEPNTKYLISVENGDNGQREVCFYNSNYTVVNGNVRKFYTNKGNFTTTAETSYIRFAYYKNATNVQLKEDGLGTISEKIVNKNLIGLGTQLNGYRNNNTGKMVLDSGVIGYYFPTKLLPTQITFNGTNGNRANVSYYNEIPASGVDALSNTNSNTLPRTITVDKTYKYIHIQFSYNVTNVTEIQVEANTTATSYIAPAEQTYTIPVQQPMRKIGDVQDEFIKVNGEWKERHNIGRILCNGTENWSYRQNEGHNRFDLPTPNAVKGSSSSNPIKANYFKSEYALADGNI